MKKRRNKNAALVDVCISQSTYVNNVLCLHLIDCGFEFHLFLYTKTV
jgi:hypothetical protein